MKGVNQLLDATGGRPANIHGYHAGSVAYLAPDALDFAEVGELTDENLVAIRHLLSKRDVQGC